MSSHVEKIKEKLPIHEVVSSYIELKKAGNNYKGKCPFHNEKTPSFFVSPNRDNYYCFGCGENGDIFTFVEKFEGLDFKGALKVLAEKAGVEIVNEKGEKKDRRDKLFEVMEIATIFFQQNLNSKSEVIHYLSSRAITENIIHTWRIGYASNEWRTLFDFLKQKGISEELMLEVGLIKKGNEGKYYDAFRDRIMFPIFDSSGRVVAFSGRIFTSGTDAAKYINSPETPLFVKSETLYGLNFAKHEIRKKNYSVLVEGQFDLILSQEAGVVNTVASSGTAFTMEHLLRLNKISPRIILAFDTDTAGFNATLKAGEMALRMGMEVKVGNLAQGKDPADIAGEDPETWKECLRRSTHIIEFYLEHILSQGESGRSLMKLVSEKILPFVALLPSEMEKEYFVNLIAEKTRTKKESVWEDLKHIKSTNVLIDDEVNVQNTIDQPILGSTERRLLGITYFLQDVKEGKERFQSLAQELKSILGEDQFMVIDKKLFPEKEKLRFEIESYYGHDVPEREVTELIKTLKLSILKKEFASAMRELDTAEKERKKDQIPELLKKCQEITERIQKLKDS